jgi:hypothetical protein
VVVQAEGWVLLWSAASYGVRQHFPTSQLAEIYFGYSSLKTHPIIKK